MAILGIIISLCGLMYFAYRGVNVLVLAPIMASLAVIFHPEVPILATYTQVFMPSLGSYLLKYFPIFMLGSILGNLMSDSGAALCIGRYIATKIGSQRAILAVIIACAALTYGGVSLFVVAFCIYPIAASLFQEANIPKRLVPAAIALGSFTFTMTALPGTPAIQNAIPMPYFGTTAFAAPLLGLFGGGLMFLMGWRWLEIRAKKAKGEGYLPVGEVEKQATHVISENLPGVLPSFIPLVSVLLFNYLFSKYLIPSFETSYLTEAKFGGINLNVVLGLWSLIAALTLGILLLFMLLRKYFKNAIQSLNEGTIGSLLPIFNTASEVGYGATIASLASFILIKDAVLGIAPSYPLISEALSINILAGITGSASGGLSIALEALAQHYLAMAKVVNLSPEFLHRIASMACGGFDTLPHNGAVVTLLAICGLSHKQSYFDIFMVAVIAPFTATAICIAIVSFL